MRTLHLTLKKKFFDMILSGEKKEEYREIKIYWIKRLLKNPTMDLSQMILGNFVGFDAIKFTNGYSKNAPTFTIECLGIEIGTAKPEWSDNWQGEVFVLKLGNILN